MPLLLEDKVILVTGGSTGIGRASSLRCAKEGAALTIADINVEAGRAVAEEINANGGRAPPFLFRCMFLFLARSHAGGITI